MGKKINKYIKNAYKVASGQKLEAIIANKGDSPYQVVLRKDAFDEILRKHPDKTNFDFNKTLGFVKTIHLPDIIQKLPNKQRIQFIRKLVDKYEGYVNRVSIKPVKADQKSYINTSFLDSRKSRVKKLLSEDASLTSSPIGVGDALPTSKATKHYTKKQ